MEGRSKLSVGANFRQFFVRGLGIVLPTVLTIWIVIAAYQFVQSRIAAPINEGVRRVILMATPWPTIRDRDLIVYEQEVLEDPQRRRAYLAAGSTRAWLHADARQTRLNRWWARYSLGLNLIGLVLAVVLIYVAGLVLGSFIGRRLYHRGERLLNRLPLIGRVYPSVKQVTDFFVGEKDEKLKFNRVVAVQYPRRGVWSVGLVTGDTMRDVQDAAGEPCMTVFIPSSPTPFTGYVLIIPARDTLDLPIPVEDAIKFVVSGGVLVPPTQRAAGPVLPAAPTPQPVAAPP